MHDLGVVLFLIFYWLYSAPGDCECCALSLFSRYLGLWLRKNENTTSLVKGTSIETIDSQTQQDQLYSGLPNWAEEGRKTREVRAIFEVMASLAITNEETPSMIEEVGDGMGALGHVSKQMKLGHEGDGFSE